MLPALAAIPSFTPQAVAAATAVGSFFTWMWQKKITKTSSNTYDFDILAEYEKVKENGIELRAEIQTYREQEKEAFSDSVASYVAALPQVQTQIKETVTVPAQSKQISLTDVFKAQNLQLKENSQYLVEQSRIMNNHLLAINTTLAKFLELKGQETINSNTLTTVLSEFLPALNLSVSNLSSIPKLLTTNAEYSQILQSEVIGSLTDIQTKIESLKLSPSITNNVHNEIDTTSLNKSTEEIAKANTTLAETATLQKEEILFNKDGISTLKDSNGKVIKPREVNALNKAEQHIYNHSQNTFNWQKDFIEKLNEVENEEKINLTPGDGEDIDLLKMLKKVFSISDQEIERLAFVDNSTIFKKEET